MKNPYQYYDDPIPDEIKEEVHEQNLRLKAAVFSMTEQRPYFQRPLMLTSIKAVPPQHKGYNVVTALTDGEDIIMNYEWVKTQTKQQLAEKLAHLVMHKMLGHAGRIMGRPPRVANIGADAIINAHLNMEHLSDWTSRIEDLESLTMEGATNVLLERIRKEEPQDVKPHDDLVVFPFKGMMPCPECEGGKRGASPDGQDGDDQDGDDQNGDGDGDQNGDGDGDPINGSRARACTCGKCGGSGWMRQETGSVVEDMGRLREFHKMASARGRDMLKQAIRSTKPGKLPAGFELLVEHTEPKTNWRTHLYKHVEPARHDYGDLSRVFMSMGNQLEEMHGEHLRVGVCFDTSGSMAAYISALYGELRGLKGTFPSLEMTLYYADATLYGPYEITTDEEIPIPQGGGGTTFGPFFEAIAEMENPPRVLIYLTDGYAEFPDPDIVIPGTTVLWFVPEGEEKEEKFPFGTYVSMDLFEDQG